MYTLPPLAFSESLKMMTNSQHKLLEDYYSLKKYGTSNDRTLYIIGPYKGRAIFFSLFIHKMVKRGYRVLYLQPSSIILDPTKTRALGLSVNCARAFISADINQRKGVSCALLGISLGSYIGLNVHTAVPLKKFIVVAGGAPLMNVFHRSSMFKKHRKAVERSASQHELNADWSPFDELFKGADLAHCATLFINSLNDKVIQNDEYNDFLYHYRATGATVINRQRGHLSHTLQALSLNFRVNQIADFLS